MAMTQPAVDLEAILAARERLRGVAAKTPLSGDTSVICIGMFPTLEIVS